MLASLVIWNANLISSNPLRIALFVVLGPLTSTLIKFLWLRQHGASIEFADVVICGLGVLAAAVAAWYVPAAARLPALMIVIVMMNIYAFAGFNPLQSARPIFNLPDSAVLEELRTNAAANPDGVLLDERFAGATLNGFGFRAVDHVLLAPKLDVFKRYFPVMDPDQFNLLFNRYAHIRLARKPLPEVVRDDVVQVPIGVFTPIRNLRRVDFAVPLANACSMRPAGGVDRIEAQNGWLKIEGWAPWKSESGEQGIRVLSGRTIRLVNLTAITRPDIAERQQDYEFVKSGFRLQLESVDGNPIRANEVALVALGTSTGETRFPCCGCP